MRKWSRRLAGERDWQTVRDGVETKLCQGPESTETFLLCRSRKRREKERGMHARFAVRIEAGLASLERRLERARQPLERSVIERQLGRLLERNSRAAARDVIRVHEDVAAASELRLEWSVKGEWDDWARHNEGSHVLRQRHRLAPPSRRGRPASSSLRRKQRSASTRASSGCGRSGAGNPGRVQAHILVCFPGYVPWKTLEQWQKRAGPGRSPRPILNELARIRNSDVVLPLADGPGRELRLRCIVRPDRTPALLLDRLGLRLPERLRIPPRIARM